MMFEKEAKEYASQGGLSEKRHFFGIKALAFRDGAEFGYKLGLEAGRPKWHDLRKDPKDLPKEAGYILSPTLLLIEKLKGTSNMGYTLGKYNFSEHEFEFAHLKDVEEVIAWCEIPRFEEE